VTSELRDADPPSASDAKTVDPRARTLLREAVPAAPRVGPSWAELEDAPAVGDAGFEEPRAGAFRYRMGELLGEGGMGQVHLCHDAVFGREVAIKMMLPELESQPSIRARFLREARVQGQLEHPGIVPVHEIGVSPQGATYFTMKRVRGMTLASVIEALASGDTDTEARFSLRKLLAAFVSVCLAVDFAHGRGVLHRDLKPSNVMLGAYGEVSVLDWGLAKPDTEPASSVGPGSRPLVSDASLGPLPAEAQTALGDRLGTPGYMAPEYVLGGPATTQGDVFALGAILFEILALEPLYPRLGVADLAAAALDGADARVSTRCPARNVAPELEAICLRATAPAPPDRYHGARELSEAVERFLEGDRDLVRRKELAQGRAEEAEGLLLAGLRRGADYEELRSRAMRELGHALALDPDNAAARASMIRILTDPPDEVPPEVSEAIEASAQKQLRMGAGMGGRVMLVWFLFLPLCWWMGVRDPRVIVCVLGPIGVAAVVGILEARRPVVRVWAPYVTVFCMAFAIVATSRLFGPFMLVPTLAATYAVSMQVHPHPAPRRVALLLCCLVMVVPVLLEYTGVLPQTVTVREGAIVIRTLGTVREGPAIFFLTVAGVAMTLSACLFIARIRDALSAAERRLHLHAWHVQRMMPEGLPTRSQFMKTHRRTARVQAPPGDY
jgi:eukaryotic-like serine/threonine-protein kinase